MLYRFTFEMADGAMIAAHHADTVHARDIAIARTLEHPSKRTGRYLYTTVYYADCSICNTVNQPVYAAVDGEPVCKNCEEGNK